jgi:hypothetical protein
MATKRKSKQVISREPQQVSETVWYYENPKTLEFIVECRENGDFHRTLRFLVSSRKIIATLRRQGLSR